MSVYIYTMQIKMGGRIENIISNFSGIIVMNKTLFYVFLTFDKILTCIAIREIYL